MQSTQIGGFQPKSWGKLKRCNNEDGTEKTYGIDKRIKDTLDVVTTHIKKECSVMEHKNWTYSTKISNDIEEESATDTIPEITKATVHW